MLQKPKTLGTRTQNTCYQNPKHLLPKPKTLASRTQNAFYQTPKQWMSQTSGWHIFFSVCHISTFLLESDMYLPCLKYLAMSALRRSCHLCHFFHKNIFFSK